MILISHRGNLNGPLFEKENHPDYINNALNMNFHVEIDVWFIDNNFYLGHDKPQYNINKSFLEKQNLWCHAKNLESLYKMRDLNCVYFWHQEDDFTLTSNNFIWTYPGKETTNNSILVLNDAIDKRKDILNCAGICSDYIIRYL